ncbi:GNAT family N-acetyltransferase [Novosphingobium umbonatum]|uniref:GNAT family N-acetyltransferase n=1 Tax=Novosphingobium umbonatum TaxID=1908524 RepID=A0A3S2VBK5_9SPHN|nr:GNAT family N-acetyltransferase [Novosphingobium umbonatum]RVU03628.1 GNAT family N-acetyltransferase [Novosphingobium umbonatum]
MITVSYHANLKEIPAEIAAIFAHGQGPFDALAWFDLCVEYNGLQPLLAVAQNGEHGAVWPLAEGPDGLRPLANWYAFTVGPIITPQADGLAMLTAIAADLKQAGHARITLWPMPDESGLASLVTASLRRAGWIVGREVCDTNHHLMVAGRNFAQYLAARPGPLRSTLKRKAKKVDVILHATWSEAAWQDYKAVYAASWKPEEGSPALLRAFAQQQGEAGQLRLGLAYATLDGSYQPVAAQLWTVEAGTAYIHKLAYHEAAKPLSPGTTLSAALFARVIDEDKVDVIDFGTGDDPYKRDWMEAQRPRYRICAYRPDALTQWPAIAKCLAKRLLRRS